MKSSKNLIESLTQILYWIFVAFALYRILTAGINIFRTWLVLKWPNIPVKVFWMTSLPYFIMGGYWLLVMITFFRMRLSFHMKKLAIWILLAVIIEYPFSLMAWYDFWI